MDPNVPTLPQAATSNNVAGALQQMLLARMTSPQQDQALQQQRQQQLGEYQGALRADPSPSYSALDHSLYSWIGNIGKMRPANAAMQGIAAGGQFRGNQAGQVHQGDVEAAKAGYTDALFQEKQADAELKGLGALGRGAAGGAGKYIQFKDDKGNLYIMNNATGQRETIPASSSKAWEVAQKAGYDKAVAEGMPNPEEYSYEYANTTVSKAPKGVVTTDTVQKPAITPVPGTPAQAPGSLPLGAPIDAPAATQNDRQFIMQQEWEMEKAKAAKFSEDTTSPQYQEALRNMAVIRQEMKGTYGVDPMKAAAQPPVAAQAPIVPGMPEQAPKPAPSSIQYRDKPAQALAVGEAETVGKARGAEYQAVQQAAAAAENQLQAFNTLEKIKPNTNAAANAQEHIAGLFGALGADPNSPIIQNAIKNRESNQILDQLRNASLKAENGVQTKSDEDRIGREFPKTTDFSKAWDFGLKLGKERALRAQDRLKYFDSRVDNSSGVGKARSSWNTEMAGDPITQYLGGRLIFRSDYIRTWLDLNPGATQAQAVTAWREKEKEYQARGGRK